MAKSQRSAGSPLLPIGIIAVAVVALIAAVFVMTGTEPPDEATIIPEEANVEADDTGGEPEADSASTVGGEAQGSDASTDPQQSEGAPDEATPANDQNGMENPEGGASGGEDGSQPAAEEGAPTDGGDTGSGGADGEQGDGSGSGDQESGTSEDGQSDFLIDESSDNPGAGTPETTQPSGGGAQNPEGRDAETQLDPEPGQDVVRDTDEGGAAFVPTPSGPEGRDDSALTTE